jgi:hypothetical protein
MNLSIERVHIKRFLVPLGPLFKALIFPEISSNRSTLLAVITTLAPAFARSRAIDAPMPKPAKQKSQLKIPIRQS